MRFRNRVDAGRRSPGAVPACRAPRRDRAGAAARRRARGGRGGARLGAPLDVFLVRKIGVPGHPELAMGAIAEGGVEVVNDELLHDLGIPRRAWSSEVASASGSNSSAATGSTAARRRRRPSRGRTVILVDDGLATGATMEAAVAGAPRAARRRASSWRRRSAPRDVPAARDAWLTRWCARRCRSPFNAVGQWYDDFSQTTDDGGTATAMLSACGRRRAADAGAVARSGRRSVASSGPGRSRWTAIAADYDALIDEASAPRDVVLLGEATHGTHEFYRERAIITRRLIVEKGFTRRRGRGRLARCLSGEPVRARRGRRRGGGRRARRLPAVSDLDVAQRRRAGLRRLAARPQRPRRVPTRARASTGSTCTACARRCRPSSRISTRSIRTSARRARARYACFDRFGEDLQDYGMLAGAACGTSCERGGRRPAGRAASPARRVRPARWPRRAPTSSSSREQNARLVADAEEYYRAMFRGRVESWNLRDRHMAETLAELRRIPRSDPSRRARRRVGAQLAPAATRARPRWARAASSTSGSSRASTSVARPCSSGSPRTTGTVTAASDWDGPACAAASGRRWPAASSGCCTTSGVPRLLLPLRTDLELASGAGAAAPRARHRRDLYAGDGAPESLLPRAAFRAVRLRDSHRRDPGGRAARTHRDVGRGRTARDVPLRALIAARFARRDV